MKKLMLILVVAMAVPAMATVNFSAVCEDGVLTISYASDASEMPRGIALRVDLGDATADPADAELIEVDDAFNTYVDYAHSNSLNFAIGEGHPLAKATMAGALDTVESVFSISAGVLDEAGNQAAGPESAVLIALPISGGTGMDITISADTLRGPASGVVGSVLESNLPITIAGCGPVDECPANIPAAADYIAAGLDVDCWCLPYQCDGDIAGDKHILGYRVYTTDLAALSASWKAKIGDANLNPCADIAHDKHILGYRVYTTDLGVLAANWKLKDADLAGDCPRDAQ